MRRPAQIPPGASREELDSWVDRRLVYIHGFQHYGWYPNCCVQARIDLDAADVLRKELNQADPDPAARVTFNHIINKAVANALPAHLCFNAKRTRRDAYAIYENIDVANIVDVSGMAVQLVIPSADRMSLRELARLSHRLVSTKRTTTGERMGRFTEIRANMSFFGALAWYLPFFSRMLREVSHKAALDLLDSRPGSVLVTNPGTLGVQDCKAMLFFGNRMCCLRIMAIEQEAYRVDGEVRFRKVLPVGLDYDQRLVDAGPAVRLLADIRRNLEDPRRFSMGPAEQG